MPSEPDEIEASNPLAIHCHLHGLSTYCMICRHLREGLGLGYWAIKPESDEPAMAWCEECDTALDRDRGWSDRATELADWRLYCTVCYEARLTLHTRRGWDSGGKPEE